MSNLKGPPVNRKYLSSGYEYTHGKNVLDSSLNELSTDALTVQIGSAEPLLASFLFVLSFYEESLGGRGYITDTLQAPLDRARGKLPSQVLILKH